MKRSILFPILAIAVAGLIYVFSSQNGAMDDHSMGHDMTAAKPERVSAQATLGDVTVSNGWTKATLPGQPVGGGFVTLENKGASDDALLRVTSRVSKNVQIHEMAMDGDVMKMRELVDGLALPAGTKVEMKSGGFHIMFMDLSEAFKEGDAIPVTMTFAKAGEVTLDLPVNARARINQF